MSSAASHSPEFPQIPADASAKNTSLKTPPTRPTLVSPPKRPYRPSVEKAPKPEPSPVVQISPQVTQVVPEEGSSRYQPIAPPSEPMQYRAIGLIKGTYSPGDEQFNRGLLTTEDGAAIEAMLLGRVTSLVKKHLDLAEPHLWVVYPRTRQAEDERADQDLHVQIVGVWEPETLGLPEEEAGSENLDSENVTEATEGVNTSTKHKILPKNLPLVNENYFSIRGEVIHYDEDEKVILVKILQGVKRPAATCKAFRLMVRGTLQGRTVGYFWDLNVKRDAKTLVLDQGTPVGIVPPTKKRKRGVGSGGPRHSGPPRRGPSGGNKRPFSPRGTVVRERPLPGPSRISELPKRRES
ncbi:MAG TPA: hypothetical protein V6D07_14065 [Trichocoleus sp.]